LDDAVNDRCEAPVNLVLVRLRHAIPHADLPREAVVLRARLHVRSPLHPIVYDPTSARSDCEKDPAEYSGRHTEKVKQAYADQSQEGIVRRDRPERLNVLVHDAIEERMTGATNDATNEARPESHLGQRRHSFSHPRAAASDSPHGPTDCEADE
jgi:hypothetical protein